ncbi:hypothetical protein DDE82_005112 [Stemphylium lycopersici]|nr:hypothetical protein DDE82_005112 [Stemphylium lycopersici]
MKLSPVLLTAMAILASASAAVMQRGGENDIEVKAKDTDGMDGFVVVSARDERAHAQDMNRDVHVDDIASCRDPSARRGPARRLLEGRRAVSFAFGIVRLPAPAYSGWFLNMGNVVVSMGRA